MHTDVAVCRPGDSLSHAAGLMWDRDCGLIAVVDTDHHIVGAITDRDVCMAAYTQGQTLTALRVSSAMSHGAVSCAPDDPLAVALELMQSKQIRRVFVTDPEQRLVGIVALADITRWAEANLRRPGGPEASDIAQTLAAICRARGTDLAGGA